MHVEAYREIPAVDLLPNGQAVASFARLEQRFALPQSQIQAWNSGRVRTENLCVAINTNL